VFSFNEPHLTPFHCHLEREFVFFLLFLFVSASQLGLVVLFVVTIFNLKKYKKEISNLNKHTKQQVVSQTLSTALSAL
jgi:hypothetical protein